MGSDSLWYIDAIGAGCLGAVVAWVIRYFICRFEQYTAASLGTVISIIGGGAVLKLFGANLRLGSFYFIGLFLGFSLYSALAYFFDDQNKDDESPTTPGNPRNRKLGSKVFPVRRK